MMAPEALVARGAAKGTGRCEAAENALSPFRPSTNIAALEGQHTHLLLACAAV